MNNIYAGIVTFNPDFERLKQNINAILPQIDKLIIVDNGSMDDVESFVNDMFVDESNNKIMYISNAKNFGIAFALNQVMKVAHKEKAEWVLTLDQDTVVYTDIIDMYRNFLDKGFDDSIASLTCLRLDVNYEENGQKELADNYKKIPYSFVDSCITSGNLLSVEAWYKTRGFDNKLFIDMVDDEFCIRLRKNGYRIVRINKFGYLHERGHNILNVKFLGKEKHVFAYSKKRKYYTARNIIYMCKKYRLGFFDKYSIYLLKLIAASLIYEENKIDCFAAYFRGMIDGLKLKCTK